MSHIVSSQHVPPTVWNRFVAGLNAQLRTVRHGWIHSALIPVINWIKSHGDSQLEFHGVKIELGWFQATATGYYQLGILVVVGDHSPHSLHQSVFLESEDCPRYMCTTGCKRSYITCNNFPHTKKHLSLYYTEKFRTNFTEKLCCNGFQYQILKLYDLTTQLE